MATIGTMGTWIDPITKAGYSGPKQKETDLPADKDTGSLLGTLEGEKKLPVPETTNLSAFANILKSVTQKYNQEASANGLSTVMNTLGAENKPMSGQSLADIVNYVKGTQSGIKDIYESTVDYLNAQKKSADDQLQMLVSSGGITSIDDVGLNQLSALTGYSFDYLKSIQEAKSKTAETQESGDEYLRRATSDMSEKVKDDLGNDGKLSPERYKYWKQIWVQVAGLSPKEFDTAFSHLVNPLRKRDYELTI
jgi:hypothetical protein